ncbi:copper chaperone PCu(A)C [Shewanella sp. KX20019]|uniref:copper chaperone PCu(A)C n=1 Tax=Shewanella sp. KX20019 TaxID=2803864 RepID=UPI001926BB18|nr:copper chaperone PCu(A)C [Shewanella sp. KX20019]QQX79491.1 copper chaperone PCu(A)C [Shewanella sp. KX20019]
MKYLLSLTTMLLLTLNAQASALEVDNAWIRAMPPTSRVVPIYLTMNNQGIAEIQLVAIESEAGSVELHQTVMKGESMHMTPVASIPVSSNGTTKLAPSGYHGMMSNFSNGVPTLNTKVSLTLVFADGTKQTIDAKVIKNSVVKDTMAHHHH